jgi:uncharacterized membrane protein YedE/YeeE
MGPFVRDLISDQLNLVVALLLGIGFGFVLEQAGFSSSRRLAGVFYGYDFTVLRVFFTAAVTAMSGVLLLGYFGLLDTDAIFVNPTWLLPAIVGGAIMGVGFILGGYCPGTSVCAAAIGKIDAMFFSAAASSECLDLQSCILSTSISMIPRRSVRLRYSILSEYPRGCSPLFSLSLRSAHFTQPH